MPRTCLLIVGMHRSGTSVFADLIQNNGFFLGKDLLKGDIENVRGYFENEHIYHFNERVLRSKGASWHSISNLPICWEKDPDFAKHCLELEDIFERYFATSDKFAIKDPRLCLLLPLYLAALQHCNIRPVVVHVKRDLSEVVASLRRRRYSPVWRRYPALRLVAVYEIALQRHLKQSSITHICFHYPEFLRDTKHALERLQAFINDGTDKIDINKHVSVDLSHEDLPFYNNRRSALRWKKLNMTIYIFLKLYYRVSRSLASS